MMAAAPSLDAPTRYELESLLTEFAWRVDHGEAVRVAELFTENGRIVTPMFTAEGREAIAAHFRACGGRRTRHLWSNFRVEAVDGGGVRAVVCVVTFLRQDDEAGPAQAYMVGDSYERFERDAAGAWRFAERRLVVAFPPAANPAPGGGSA
jgi:ketosteroid isomerase-like protein